MKSSRSHNRPSISAAIHLPSGLRNSNACSRPRGSNIVPKTGILDHRSWQQRGGYNGYRIPDDRFRGSFGQDHEFRISGLPFLVVGGYPRFQYEGFWFSMVDPWPQAWTSNWYDTDDVYVLYVDNGYYLFDRRYPNIGMAISISM